MSNQRLRLLYLSNAFPPGVTGRFPSLNPAGHTTETRMAQALSQLAQVSTIGLLPGEVYGQLEPKDTSLGLEHELLLWDREPVLWYRWLAWRKLRRFYISRATRSRVPDILLVRNLSPVFNRFVNWLRRQDPRPRIVLVLADSGTLGQHVKFSRRLRYALKPMQTLDAQAVQWYDACISFGNGTRRYFEPRGVPWLWMPSAFNFRYDPPPGASSESGPIRFGYFGALAEHASVLPMVKVFLAAQVPGTLHVCGFGKLSDALQKLAGQHPRFRFDGLLQTQADCLAWAQQVDVLINPRLPVWGLENSFPSKIFEFTMTGKAILTTRTGGVDEVLGPEAFYLETENFEVSLREKLRMLSATDRAELQRRGTLTRQRILRDFNWDEQARHMITFMTGVLQSPSDWPFPASTILAR
jgi:glycosyltransferase involved in cell wall biosynthesis